MNQCIICFTSILLLIPALSFEQITINGKAPLLRDKNIRLFKTDDYITERQILIAQTQLNDDKSFSITAPLNEVSELSFMAGSVKNPFYAEPGKTYSIEIADESGTHMFFTELPDTQNVLYLIGQFNYEYNFFTINNYDKFVTGTIREEAKKFIAQADSKYKHITVPFFQQHKTYKLAELALSARVMGQKKIFETYFKDKPILYHHPEYMRFFKSFYGGMMLSIVNTSKNEKIKSVFREGKGYDSLIVYVTELDFVKDKNLAEIFIMQGLFEMYYSGKYDKYKIESLLRECIALSQNKEIIKIATNFIELITRLKPGSPAPDFIGKDLEAQPVKLSSFFNKPIYLTFFDPHDPACIKEIPGIKNLFDKYKKDIHFITVCSACSYGSLQDFITQYGLKWTFLIVEPDTEANYEVLAYPMAFLLKKDGIFFRSPAELPSQNLEDYLYKVRR
jgi:peroxiredoxin